MASSVTMMNPTGNSDSGGTQGGARNKVIPNSATSPTSTSAVPQGTTSNAMVHHHRQHQQADDSAISFSDDDSGGMDQGPMDVGSIHPAAFNAAAAAAAFQRQLFANFPLFQEPQQQQTSSSGKADNPFETYIAAAAAAAAAANAEALIRQQMSLAGQGGEKRPANDSGTDDNDHHQLVNTGGGNSIQPSNKRRKQSKPVRITNDGSPTGDLQENSNNAAVTAFLAQTAAMLQQQQQEAQEEENNSGGNPTDTEQEEGQIIRNSIGLVDQARLLSNPALLAEFLGKTSSAASFPFYGGWNPAHHQQMMEAETASRSSTSPEEGGLGKRDDSFKYSSGFPSHFLYPFLPGSQQQQQSMMMQGGVEPGSLSRSAMIGGLRIFNHEAYCELCNKEFCNKYFLKTHKANKHGIYVDAGPPTTTSSPPSGSNTPVSTAVSAITTPTTSSTNGGGIPVTSAPPPLISASYGPPLSLTVGAMSYPMHPPPPNEPTDNYSPTIPSPVTSSSLTLKPPSITSSNHKNNSIPTYPPLTSSSSSSGLMDFFPLWSSSPSTITTSAPSVSISMMGGHSGNQQSGKPGGIINPEAYCDLCQKEFCNKYFLKRHKAKMHGIAPPEAAAATTGNSANPTTTTTTTTSTPNAPGSVGSGGGSHHKKSRSAPHPKSSSSSSAGVADLIKIPIPPPPSSGMSSNLTPPTTILNNNTTSLFHSADASAGQQQQHHPDHQMDEPGQMLGRDASSFLSMLKMPSSASLSNMFGSSNNNSLLDRPKSGSSSSQLINPGAGQLFTPERLRQMGVINTEAFCEICCKEFCNKYFLRTHKFKKHGVGSLPEPAESSGSNGSSSNNNKNSPKQQTTPQQQQMDSEQKTPLNLVSSASTTPPAPTDPSPGGGMLTCDQCQRPFQSAYLLHMHRTYFHNLPEADEPSDMTMMEEDEEMTNPDQDRSGSTPVKCEAPPPSVEEDGQVNISADLQKLQSMIMELNGSSARSWMTSDKTPEPPQQRPNGTESILSVSSGGGIVKINPADQPDAVNTPVGGGNSLCQLCGNKDFFTPYFLQMHLQNYHGVMMPDELGGSMLDLSGGNNNNSGSNSSNNKRRSGSTSGGGGGGGSSSTRSYCTICNKELCNKYFMKTHMLKMHGIHLEASGGGSQIGGVQCDICHKELCSKYFLKVHKQNSHGIQDQELMMNGLLLPSSIPGGRDQQGGVMDLSFHHQHSSPDEMNMPTPSSSPAKSSSTVSLSTETCPLCPKRFKSSKALKAHLSHDHSSSSGGTSSTGSSFCYICNQQFGNDLVALQVHLIKSHASQLMRDQEQTKTPPSSGNTTQPEEMMSHHEQQQQQGGIQCPLCGESLTLEQFHGHLMDHQLPGNLLHTLTPAQPAGGIIKAVSSSTEVVKRRRKRFRCSVCCRKFSTRQLCLTHILHRHPPNSRRITSPAKALVQLRTSQLDQSRPLTCPRCGYATRQPQLLRLHLRTQQCIPVLARNPDLQQLPPYLAVPTAGQHSHRQDFVLQAFLLSQPEKEDHSNGHPGSDQDHPTSGSQFIPSLILLPVNRRIANPLSLTFSLTPA